MGGLLILFLGALYIWGALKVVSLVEQNWAKLLLVLIFVLIPTADAVFGRIKLRQMCEAEGGLKVDHVVEGVEGFYNSGTSPSGRWLKIDGFRFSEGDGAGGRHERVLRTSTGIISVEHDISLISKYAYRVSVSGISDTYLVTEFAVYDLRTNEILGKVTDFGFAGGWIERLIASLYASRGNGGSCNIGYPENIQEQLVLNTLRPAK